MSEMKTSVLLLGILLMAPLTGEAQMLYWADTANGSEALWRINRNGSGEERLLVGTETASTTNIGNVSCIAIDERKGHVYLGEAQPNRGIRRVNLDGSGFTNLIAGGAIATPAGLALDLTNRKMYFTHTYGAVSKIKTANLDGSGITDLCDAPAGSGIALDLVRGKMYWTQGHSITGVIRRANLDGSGVTNLITDRDAPSGIAIDTQSEILYWVTKGQGAGPAWKKALVQKSSLDGTGIVTLYDGAVVGIDRPGNIAFVRETGKLYIGSAYGWKLECASVDGSGITYLGSGSPDTIGLAFLPPPKGTMFTNY